MLPATRRRHASTVQILKACRGLRGACIVVAMSPLIALQTGVSDNPRVGTWKLNLARSIFNDGPAPQSELQICEAIDANTIKLRVTRVDSKGTESRREYTAHYDG